MLIRTARGGEVDLAFALMPYLANQGVPPEAILVALRPGMKGIAGVAAFSATSKDNRMPGLRAGIFVLPSQRRQGAGRALLSALRALAARWDVDYLHSWHEWADGEAPPFLSHMGALRRRTLYYFEADSAAGHLHCTDFLERLSAAGRLPAAARAEPLQPCHWQAAAQLHALHSATPRPDLLRHFEQTCDDPQNAALSFALMLDGQLIGFLLCNRDQGLPAVDLWLTHPRYRNGWPALMLLQASSLVLLERGLARCRFHCNDESRATLGMARRSGAELIQTTSNYAIAI